MNVLNMFLKIVDIIIVCVAIIAVIMIIIALLSNNKEDNKKTTKKIQQAGFTTPVFDKKIVDTIIFLAKTAVLTGTANSGISSEANIYELDNKGYVSHRFFFTLNKRIPLSVNIDKLIAQAQRGENETVKIQATKDLMKYMDLSPTTEFLERFRKYLNLVRFEKSSHNEFMIQFYGEYRKEIPVELIQSYRYEIFRQFKEEMEAFQGMSEIEENTLGIEINIKPRNMRH